MESLFVHYPAFLLIVTRIASFMVTIPLFSYRTIPNQLKIGIAFYLAFIMTMTLDLPTIPLNEQFLLLLMKEAMIGLLIGLAAYIIFSAIQIAGSFIDFQMGFAIASVIDPQTGVQSPLIGQLFNVMAMLFLLSTNAHHLLIEGMLNSFLFVPIDHLTQLFHTGEMIQVMIKSFNSMFIIAFQMAFPIVGALFLVDVALGIIARTVPQLNVFVVGLPIKIGVSFLMILLVFSAIFFVMQELIEYMIEFTNTLLQLLGESN
ncbi:flagellar biosynthetic protein FliR [Bacillus sp. FJAT-47783]|uniref:flagellar biosynthetic protein FliR n=1 Tax=Bacillus sp. FJAT-47783 TaxID=2922712 RepID=UPI001FAD8619|nr:flagellar biosynthetic protein FliR [Bacillus sp. FJAT-47783]